ncbi:MAG TPA: CheR family methyltransferase [Chloroflexota bacterium]|jgi:chemotaxis methyl-accepting protein methylase|nr:CheR family methyltransferase [Chloroflexota bacterium]
MIPSASALTLTSAQRSALLEAVDRQFGIRGTEYGAARLEDAVAAILPNTRWHTTDELLFSLTLGPTPRWLYDLVEHLTVGETYFLRDPAQIAALRETILPEILLRRAAEQRLRIWSAGCSTGEEPYSLAILLLEKQLASTWDVELVGTDVNRESLRLARDGVYPAWSFRATPEYIRDRYFEPATHGWRAGEALRRMAHFAWMNLATEQLTPPAPDLDLVICRNVTIYFDAATTQRLYRTLIKSLTPGGWLILAASDPVPTDRGELERIDLSETVVWRRVAEPKRVLRSTKLAVQRAPTRQVEAISGPREGPTGDGRMELEAGLLALESGESDAAVEWLRRAAFRDPHSALGQFALARAYLQVGDLARAHAAFLHTRRLLAAMAGDALVPGSDTLLVETLRQAVRTSLDGPA